MATRSSRAAILEDPEVDETEAEAEAPATSRGKKKVETEQQVKARLRNAAERHVLNEHRPEYYAKLQELHEAEGIEFKRVLTPEEKDEQALAELLNRRPDLRAKIVQEHAPEAESASA